MATDVNPAAEPLQRLEKILIRAHFIAGIALSIAPFLLRALASSLGEAVPSDASTEVVFMHRPFWESVGVVLPGILLTLAYVVGLKVWMARRGLSDDVMVMSWFALAAGIAVVYVPWYVATFVI